ncbi:hypothetical protein Pint_25497 [Pistacia integerrima]|uniref:Uncharacterized protein n=1 Tax=Pistacia integerrima TaxID=434235 RepID=A0ACC0YAZ7_9ROSI|nr:hypothetical protein Pint_25497 [Pistacia integerrima]
MICMDLHKALICSEVVEVVISAFQRISDSFEPKELHLMSECLYQEIIDCIANGCLLHLSNLLLLRIATIQIDKGFKVPDHQSMLGLVDLLVRTFVIPSGDGKEVDKLSEVIDKVLQLMLCILDGIHRIDDMSTVSDCTSQWAPVFKLRNSSLLTFIRGLLLKDPCILYTFRVHILSAMNDLIETSSEEVICLLLSYSEKLQMNPQYNNLLDGIPEGVLSRICNFLQEEISSLIKIVRGNLSSIKFDETKLALMWGAIRCYAHILDVQTNSSLLMDLIDALDILIRNDGGVLPEVVAGVPKHIWQSLAGAALTSYNEWHWEKKSGLEETSKVLHLAKTCKSSSQVLSAVADYLDYVHGITLQEDNSRKEYQPELKAEKAVDAVETYADNLCQSDKTIRVPTLRILCHYEPYTYETSASDQPPEKKMKTETGVSDPSSVDFHGHNVVQLLLSIETTPLSISTSRKIILLISRVQMILSAGRIPEMYIPVLLNGVIGILHNRFSYLWNPASECLAVLVSKHVGLVWDKFVDYFQQCQCMFQRSHNQLDKISSESYKEPSDLVERFNIFVSPASDSTPCATVLSLLLQALQKIPFVVESRSQRIISLLLEFLGYDSTDLTSVGSFNSDICKGKEWKGVLKEWLNLLKLMRNPKSFYRSQFLKDVLQNRLLDENDAEIQMKVLDCLLMWRDGFLIPYDQHLKNLINSKNLREEVTTWSLSRESVLIEDAHRAYLVPLVIRLLVPKVRKLKTLASRKQASIYHRKALLGFIAQLDVDELPLFFTLLIKSLNIIPKGADVDVFWTTPNYTMDNFHELSFLKYFNIENLAILSWKKSHGFLHVIEDVFGVFDESHIRPFLHLLMGCVVRILVSCTSSIVAAKGGSSSIKDHSSTDLTVHEHDRPVGNDVLTSSAVKQLKDLRSLCLRIISSVLNKYDDHDYGCEFWDLFFKSVKPLVDAFKQEGSSSEKPSSLFSCFLAMSRSHELVSLLYREKNLVPDIFSILSVTTASEAIVSSVLMFIENLLNLDSELGDEDSAINKLLLPNLEALICSMHYRFQSATKRKLLKSSGETEIRIFKLLSKYIKDPSMARKFVDILLPFLVKGVKDSGFSVKILDVLQDIIPVVETGSTKKILNAVCPLLVSVELEMRLSICHLLVELAKADPSVFPVVTLGLLLAELVSQLNATSSEEMNSLDYDSIVAAYDKIDIDLFHTTEVDYALLILSHCVYDMSSEDLILRKSAQRIMLLFVDFSSLILDGEKCNGHESTRIVEGSWTITSIQRIMKNFILKHMGEAMNSGSKVKKEWIDLLREMILKLPQLSNLSSLRDLCSGDTEVDFFNNIIHLQKHRRARALTRFRKVVSASSMPEDLLNKVFVPLFFSMLFDVQDENVRSACSEALASISALMEWKSYSALLIRCFQEMEKNQQKQKILLRLFCSILDQFHFSEIFSGQEAKYSLDDALGANTSRTNSSLVDDRSSTIVSEIKTWLHEIMLPKVQKLLNFDSEKVNVDISRAALKLLKLLPGDIMDSQLPSIIHRISNFLKSRSDSMRNSARLSLADCLKELGLEYLKFILGVLRATLKRGYEMHVLGYTLNFILSKNLSNPIGGKLDYCLEDLLSAVKNDILGDVAEEKEVEKIASKMIETKKQKSFETLELIAKNITFKTHALKLLSVVTTHLQMHLTPKTKSKLESMLSHIAAGIDCNQSVDQTDLFVFIYGLIEDRMKEENDLHSSSASTGTNNHKSAAKDKTISSGRVIVAKSACSHLITVFALGLLQKRLKNLRSNKHDEKHLSMLDSFVTLLGNCLSSKYEDVLSASLRCLTSLVSLPLPSLESQADKIKATLLDIAQSSVNSGSPLMQSCLSLLTKLLRSTKITLSSDQLHLLIQFPVFIDLERNPSDVALSLLKAIVSRKLVVHEIYDIVVRVAELMVTSQVESIRKKSSQISLHYEHSSGREAVLEMLHAIIKKFPQTKLDEQSHTLFVHLVARLANDHDNKVRSMTGVAIKLLIERINPHMLHSILEYSLSWYLGMKQQLWSAGAQTCFTAWVKQTMDNIFYLAMFFACAVDDVCSHAFSGKTKLLWLMILVLGLLVEVMKRNFQRHISAVLPVTRSILQSTINIVRDGQLDLSDEVTIPFWKEAYYSLVLLEKILCQFPDFIFDRDLENIWEAICELMLHPHTWLRNRSNRLIALYFSALTEASKQHQEKARENLFLMKPSRIFMIAVSLCYQLETQLTFDEAFSNRITQNLVSAICTMHSLREQRECIDPHNFWSALGPHEQGLFLKAFKLLESRKGKGIFLSIISSTSDQNDQDQPKDFQFLLVSNLLRKMGKIALQKEAIQMKILFNSFRLISSEIGPSHCQLYAYQMLPSLYKVCEGFAGKLITDDMKQLAQEEARGKGHGCCQPSSKCQEETEDRSQASCQQEKKDDDNENGKMVALDIDALPISRFTLRIDLLFLKERA